MKPETTLIYDGSFNGFLTAVFDAFEQRLNVVDIQKNNQCQNQLFSGSQIVYTQVDKAKRVWNGIRDKNHNAIANVYFAFLGEAQGVEHMLYTYIQKLMCAQKGEAPEHSGGGAMFIDQLARKVGREKHRMEALTHFQSSKDSISFALIDPDFDVLPLISKYFRDHYRNQAWLIYDTKRGYGIFYDMEQVRMVSLDLRKLRLGKGPKIDAQAQGEPHSPNQLIERFKNSPIKSLIKPKLRPMEDPKSLGSYGRILKEVG